MVRVSDDEPTAPPLATLEYQPPPPPARSRPAATWGILISFFLGNGIGWMVFGALLQAGFRDDPAGALAVGAGSTTFAGGLIATCYLMRRFPSAPR